MNAVGGAVGQTLNGAEPTVQELYDAVEEDLYAQPDDLLQLFYDELDYRAVAEPDESLLPDTEAYTVDDEDQTITVDNDALTAFLEARGEAEENMDWTALDPANQQEQYQASERTNTELMKTQTGLSPRSQATLVGLAGASLVGNSGPALIDAASTGTGNDLLDGGLAALGAVAMLGAPLLYRHASQYTAEDATELHHRTVQEFVDTYGDYQVRCRE